jgi:hypothetical protein
MGCAPNHRSIPVESTGIASVVVTRRLRAVGIRDRSIIPASPWQNGFAERLIGSIRRECVDHIIVLGEAHLRRILISYAVYYNSVKTHRSLHKDAPIVRPIRQIGIVRSHPILGGLHHHSSGFEFSVHTAEDRPHPADLRPIAERNQRPKRSGAIFLQASTSPCTTPTDLSKASRSLPASSISTMRSTPFDPITTGTPTYMSFTPYSPLR